MRATFTEMYYAGRLGKLEWNSLAVKPWAQHRHYGMVWWLPCAYCRALGAMLLLACHVAAEVYPNF